MKIGETAAPRSQRVNVRRAQHRVTRATQVIGAVLVASKVSALKKDWH